MALINDVIWDAFETGFQLHALIRPRFSLFYTAFWKKTFHFIQTLCLGVSLYFAFLGGYWQILTRKLNTELQAEQDLIFILHIYILLGCEKWK